MEEHKLKEEMENMVRLGKEEMESGSRSDIHHIQEMENMVKSRKKKWKAVREVISIIPAKRGDGEHEERKKWKADREVVKSKVDCP
ncbi:hypothetical protein Tco_0368537 [Tanacetum coccineum]